MWAEYGALRLLNINQVFAGLYVETDNPLKFQKSGGKVHGYSSGSTKKNWYFLGIFPILGAGGARIPKLYFGGHCFWFLAKSDIFIPICTEGGNQSAQKSLAELEGLHPCNGKNPLYSILQLPR